MTDLSLPPRIDRLGELANNLWWSWHPQARNVFRTLDYQLWKLSGHNPVMELDQARSDTLQAAAADPSFLNLYDSVMSAFDNEMANSGAWFTTNYPDLAHSPIAYFSMEYAIHNSLPIYAGGLGVLAGDVCKEASDLGLPLIAVGFMYPQGYFHQHLCAGLDSCQQEVYEQLEFDQAPISRVLSAEGRVAVANVQLGGTNLAIGVWQVRAGRTNIYLLDTNLEENPAEHRQLSARLYVADRERRLQQEIVLGIGGVRVLRKLDINPVVWHVNEGHTAFMTLERIREELAGGTSFGEAMSRVQSATVFTTHTPVQAGHDIFPAQLVDKYLKDYYESLGIGREVFFQLGQQTGPSGQSFNMSALGMRLASLRCAVSRLHGEVTRRMWHGLWPDVAEDQVPVIAITNGVHVPSWIAPELHSLLEGYLGRDWIDRHDDSHMWQRLLDVSDDELWAVHQLLKHKLINTIRHRARQRWLADSTAPAELPAMGTLLDPEVLTIAFARRFAEYKRPALVFRDIERLRRIVTDEWRPVQFVFAGKSHPADLPSKLLIKQVYQLALDRQFQGRIAFVENHNMHLARYLVQGADVWLNTPRRAQEACGTSGMKASLNGVLHLSVREGWWCEGFNGANGWAIGSGVTPSSPEEEDEADAEALYRLLEEEIIPLYYSRDRNGVPHGWVRMVKEAIRSIAPAFCARRMLKEYTERMYRPVAKA
ncbi:MAG: alpha-glucan family phosphorylase [Dehalococcoidales bacterium]|nr:alpha-glucan family phosphorylase [Dehalococcoidales bacterium]